MEKAKHGDEILNIDYNKDYSGKEITHTSMINPADRKKVSLNGMWNFEVDLYNTALRKRFFEEQYVDGQNNELPLDYAFDDWQKAMVPFCFNTYKEEYFWYEGNVVFTRKFRYTETKEQRVFLKVGSANYESKVFLNKQYLGRHIGGYTPYYVDVTDYLQVDNRIIIMANNERVLEGIPSINTDWFNYGGLQRDIELIYVPKQYIKDYFTYLKNDNKYNKIVCQVEIVGEDKDVTVEIEELGIKEIIKINNGKGEIELSTTPILWDTENPKLYNVNISYNGDRVSDKIGFRQISTDGNKILLNGKEIFLRGICQHEESAKNGRALTDEERKENLALVKELGCNATRLAHYPHHENMAKFADEMGILLWEEVPVYWALQFSNPETYENAKNQLLELITRDRNRASVIVWSVGNENPDSDERFEFMKNLAREAKKLDPSRMTSAACLVTTTEDNVWIGDRLAQEIDIIGINEYYGWYDRDFSRLDKMLKTSADLNKPVFITETGGGALSGHRGNELFTEDYQEQLYKDQVSIIEKNNIQGLFPWILYDFRTPVRLGKYQRRYNRKGLLNPEKTYKKLAFYVLQDFYNRINPDSK